MPAFTAACFEHDFVAEKLGCHRRDPTEKLLRVSFVFLREVLPLPAETGGSCTFITLDLFEVCEAWNAGSDWKRGTAGATAQLAFDDFQIGRASCRGRV